MNQISRIFYILNSNKKRASNNIYDMCFALEKVYRPKGTFFEELCIEKEPSICSEHFTVGIFAMRIITNILVFVTKVFSARIGSSIAPIINYLFCPF